MYGIVSTKHTDRQIGFNQTTLCTNWLESCCIFKHNYSFQSLQKASKLAMAKVEELNETDMSRTGVGRCWTSNFSNDVDHLLPLLCIQIWYHGDVLFFYFNTIFFISLFFCCLIIQFLIAMFYAEISHRIFHL